MRSMLTTEPNIPLTSDHDYEKDRYQSSSYFDNMSFCHVFDCLEGWSSFLGGRSEDDEAKVSDVQHYDRNNISSGLYSQRINPVPFQNPLAEKMVRDAVHRSKFNTKSQRERTNSVSSHGYLKDHHDKNDDLLDERIAMAAKKKRQRQQGPSHSSSISYSRKQHRLLQQQQQVAQQKQAQQESQSALSKLNCRKKPEPERPQTPMPIPGPSRLNPKMTKRATQIVPKRKQKPSTMTLLKRKDASDSKRQSPPTSYCPPVSTPLVPIGERKAMKEKKPVLPIGRNRKVGPSFQPDEYY